MFLKSHVVSFIASKSCVWICFWEWGLADPLLASLMPAAMPPPCTRVLQCVAMCCSVLQCVAVRCSALQCVAVCCSVLQCVAVRCNVLQCFAVCCSASIQLAMPPRRKHNLVLQCVAVCCSALQCEYAASNATSSTQCQEGYGSIHTSEGVCCSVLHCVVVWCIVLQWHCQESYDIIKTFEGVFQSVAVCCSAGMQLAMPGGLRRYTDVRRGVAVCCSVLQCVAVYCSSNPRRATAL